MFYIVRQWRYTQGQNKRQAGGPRTPAISGSFGKIVFVDRSLSREVTSIWDINGFSSFPPWVAMNAAALGRSCLFSHSTSSIETHPRD